MKKHPDNWCCQKYQTSWDVMVGVFAKTSSSDLLTSITNSREHCCHRSSRLIMGATRSQ